MQIKKKKSSISFSSFSPKISLNIKLLNFNELFSRLIFKEGPLTGIFVRKSDE